MRTGGIQGAVLAALRLYTRGSAWFSNDDNKKGATKVGQLADLAVLTADYFSVPEEEIKRLESVLTIVGGKVVHTAGLFVKHAPPSLPVSPDWSPIKEYGGYFQAPTAKVREPRSMKLASVQRRKLWHPRHWWDFGCDCFAFCGKKIAADPKADQTTMIMKIMAALITPSDGKNIEGNALSPNTCRRYKC